MSVPADPGRALGFLLLRRDGVLWGVANAAVGALSRRGGGFRVGVGTAELAVDEIVGVVPHLAVTPLASVLRRFWPEAANGLAVYAGGPLVVVDPRRPPRALIPGAGEE